MYKNNTKIYVSKKAQSIVEEVVDNNEGNPNQKNRGRAFRYEVYFVDGTIYGSNVRMNVQNHIVDRYREEREEILEEADRIAEREEKARLDRIEQQQLAKKASELTKVAQKRAKAKEESEDEEECRKEAKRIRDRRYRAKNLEAVRARDREYRRKRRERERLEKESKK